MNLFFRRNRGRKEGESPYSVIPESVTFDADSLRAELFNSKNNITLTLSVDTLQRNTARIRIKEANPIRSRYECKDSLVKEPVKVR